MPMGQGGFSLDRLEQLEKVVVGRGHRCGNHRIRQLRTQERFGVTLRQRVLNVTVSWETAPTPTPAHRFKLLGWPQAWGPFPRASAALVRPAQVPPNAGVTTAARACWAMAQP